MRAIRELGRIKHARHPVGDVGVGVERRAVERKADATHADAFDVALVLAEHAGNAIAAQLVLSDGDTDYLSVSGLDPDYWELSLNTLLIYNAAATEAVY